MRPVVGDVEAEMLVVGSIQLGHRKHVTTFEQQISVQISTNTFSLRVSSSTILWVILMSLRTSFLQISISICQWQMSSLVSKLDKELEKSLDAGLKLDPNIGDCLEISVMRKR